MDRDGLSTILEAAHLWQLKGWPVIPAQPNSKELVAGFGIYKNKVEPGEKTKFWFTEKSVNIAVVAPPGEGLILDFDKLEVYHEFCKKWPKLAASYTESTPRTGRHVFFWTSQPVPYGTVLKPGIEVKQIVLVTPSKVGGQYYRVVVHGEILRANILEALEPFRAQEGIKQSKPPRVRVMGQPVAKKGYIKPEPGLIEEIKRSWPILDYLRYFEPKLILSGQGRWLAGRCPWHEDTHPSLWVDTERNLWGCHGCGAHGDILNWHASLLEVKNIGQAIRDLARYKVELEGQK